MRVTIALAIESYEHICVWIQGGSRKTFCCADPPFLTTERSESKT